MVARLAMFICLLVAVAFAGNAFWQKHNADESQRQSDEASVRATGLVDAAPKRLAPEFTDENHTLLADPPKDATKLVDPPTLVLCHLIEKKGSDDGASIVWEDLEKYLSTALGRPVTDMPVDNGPSQIDKIKTGAITIMALHGADAPFLVNNCGYHPVGVLGDDSGPLSKRMDIIVPAKSTLARAADLKGQTLTCTGPLSVVGYRAAILLLLKEDGLRPNVDYFVTWSLGQDESIAGVARGTYPVAAVSDDKLQSCLAKGHVKLAYGEKGSTSEKVPVDKSMFKTIYQSPGLFPATTIGYFYNLKPELAGKLRAAIMAYKPTASDEVDEPMHFLPVDYSKDFALIRDIDDRFDPRLDNKARRESPATLPVAALR
jgi:phosphonate transport system substrate-binding protein